METTIREIQNYLNDNVNNLDPEKTFKAMNYVVNTTTKERFSLKHSCFVLCKVCEVLYKYKENVAKVWTELQVFYFLQKYYKYMLDSMFMYQQPDNPIRLFYIFLRSTYQEKRLAGFYKKLDDAADCAEESQQGESVKEFDWGASVDGLSWN